MRDKAIPALTMIVAAGVIGVAQARLPRPIRLDRDRVSVEMSATTRFHPIVDRAEPVCSASIGWGDQVSARSPRSRNPTAHVALKHLARLVPGERRRFDVAKAPSAP